MVVDQSPRIGSAYSAFSSFFYLLMLAFPSWAGLAATLYMFVVCRLSPFAMLGVRGRRSASLD